jgi:hypothetical protein
MDPVFPDQASASDAIEAFSAQALVDGGTIFRAPAEPLFEASFDGRGSEPGMAAAGWRQTSDTEYEVQLDGWAAAREPLAAAMGAAIAPWMPYFGSHTLSSQEALEQVHDEAILVEGRERFAAWLQADHPDWVSATHTAS